MKAATILNAHLRNQQWVEQHLEHLLAKYGEMYVAVANEAIIAAGKTLQDIQEDLDKGALFPSRTEVTIVYLAKEPAGMLL